VIRHTAGGSHFGVGHLADVAAGEGAVDGGGAVAGGGGGVAARAEALAESRFDGAIYGFDDLLLGRQRGQGDPLL